MLSQYKPWLMVSHSSHVCFVRLKAGLLYLVLATSTVHQLHGRDPLGPRTLSRALAGRGSRRSSGPLRVRESVRKCLETGGAQLVGFLQANETGVLSKRINPKEPKREQNMLECSC